MAKVDLDRYKLESVLRDLIEYNGSLVIDQDWIVCKSCGMNNRDSSVSRLEHEPTCIVSRAKSLADQIGGVEAYQYGET